MQNPFNKKTDYQFYHPKEKYVLLETLREITTETAKESLDKLEQHFASISWDLQNLCLDALKEDLSLAKKAEKLTELHPDCFILNLILAYYCMDIGWNDRGDDYIDTVTDEGFYSFVNYLEKGKMYFGKCAEIKPNSGLPFLGLMSLSIGLGDTSAMFSYYEKAKAVEPKNPTNLKFALWGMSPRWSNHTMTEMYDFMMKERDDLDLDLIFNDTLFCYYLDECNEEMADAEFFDLSQRAKVPLEKIAKRFQPHPDYPYYNVYYANCILQSAYAIMFNSEHLKSIVDYVFPGKIHEEVWSVNTDKPEKIARYFKRYL